MFPGNKNYLRNLMKSPNVITNSEDFEHTPYDDPLMVQDYTTPFLDLDNLKKEERNSDKTKLRMYKIILAKCHEKIKRTNRRTEHRQCYFDIPFFLPGYPVYDVSLAKQYVMNQLMLNGLFVKDVATHRIYIAWRDDYVNRQQYLSQLNKVMPKPNIYKLAVSPLDERQRNTEEETEEAHTNNKPKIIRSAPRKVGKNKYQESNVSMLQWDDRIADMVPVNSHKAEQIYGEPSRSHSNRNMHENGNHNVYDFFNDNDPYWKDRRERLNQRIRENRQHREIGNDNRRQKHRRSKRRDNDDEESNLESKYFSEPKYY